MNKSKDRYYTIEVWENPDRMGGKPCIAGTRIPVEIVLELGIDKATSVAYYGNLRGIHLQKEEHANNMLSTGKDLTYPEKEKEQHKRIKLAKDTLNE
jgi:uncharacterized protein (DUF433 family)